MDIKRLVIGMAAAMALMFGWRFVQMKLYEQHPEWKRPDQVDAVKAETPASQPAPAAWPTTGMATTQQGATTQGAVEVKAAAEATKVALGSPLTSDKTYALQMQTTGRGAGIDGVVLNQFWASVHKEAPYKFQTPYEGQGNADESRVLATRWVNINGQQYDLLDKNWVKEASTAESTTYSIDIGTVRVRKTFEVHGREEKPVGSMGYESRVTQTIENLGAQPVTVSTAINGPIPPVREIDSVDDRQVISGYQVEGSVAAMGHPFTALTAATPSIDMTKDKNGRIVTWFGASSVYFDAILRPLPAPKGDAEMGLKGVSTRALNADEKVADHRMVTTMIETGPVTLAAGGRATLPMEVFFGPKQRALLNNAYYSAVPLGYDTTLSTNLSGCANYCTFGWLINALVVLLGFFHLIVRDWGLAIILLVAVVRTCLHPITKRSQMSMMKMGKMGPEIEKLKKKYGDDKEGLNKAMMGVYKEQGTTPILGCLPMFLQMPIWVALYSSLQNTFELRHAGFLQFGTWGLTWIKDLAKADRLYTFPTPINFYFGHLDAINLLPILMAVVFWMQQKYTPKPPASTPEQEQQQKMMQWMSLLFPVFLYNGPAGLNLYIMTSTAVGILESKRIRKHIKEREEAEKEGRIIVEPTRKMRLGGGGDQGSTPAKSGGIAGWLADLQTKAEEMRKQQQKKK